MQGGPLMKTLLLMRHAKSSWKDKDIIDHERPLNKRGKTDAPLMGKLIKDKELTPELILCSSAKRTVLTAVDVMDKAKVNKKKLRLLDSLYLAEPEVYLKELCELPDDIERVLVIGHNPGLEGLLQILSGRIESLPTGAIAYLSVPITTWKELTDTTEVELIALYRPKELKKKSKK